LSEGLLKGLEQWRALCVNLWPEAWVFPSERGTPLSRDNILRRYIEPRLASVGLSWVNFQVMRRTHSTLMNNMGVEGKLVADQLGHSLDVNQNVYTKSPAERRKVIVDQLESALLM
jgi:integrase